METKACAIVSRDIAFRKETLIFNHPLVGVQFVKGGRKGCETPIQTAKRELFEESGLEAISGNFLAQIAQPEWNQTWSVIQCDVVDAPEIWSWTTLDDFGHVFSFFWHDLTKPAPANMAVPFQRVLDLISALAKY